MQARIAEMQILLQRSNALDHGWEEWRGDTLREMQAAIDYSSLKNELAERMKAFDRLRFDGPTPWSELTYGAGIRHAHQAMVARSGSGPNNPKWHTAVQALQSELSYYLHKLEKGAS